MSRPGSDRESEPSHLNPGWIVVPILALLSLVNALVGTINAQWSEVGLLVVALATMFLSSAFGRAHVSMFANYRAWGFLTVLLVLYAVLLLIGLWPLIGAGLESGKLNRQLVALFLVLATAPVEVATWWLARTDKGNPALRRALSWWLPAMLAGQAAAAVVLSALDHRHPGVLRPLHYFAGLGVGPLYLLFFVQLHFRTLSWQSRVDAANERAKAADTARQLAEARLAVLQAQIEPHFLFNTLATVEYLQKSDPDKAAELLGQLNRYLRLAMPSMRQLSSTLGREFELTDAYLQIARLRTGGRLVVEVELPQALADVEFPPLVVQTLVENAIKHGVEPKPGPVRIQVFALRVGAELHVGVQDNGVGLRGVTAPDGGTGLQNIRERLRGLHGERAQLSIVGLAEGGVLATVVVPLQP
jgi:signal transduction histidine kinase